MRQNRSRGRSQTTQRWPNRPQFQQPGLLLPAWCFRRNTTASTLAGGIGGERFTGLGVGGLSGGVTGLGERDSGRDGGLGGAMLTRLNPRLRRATRPPNLSGEQFAGPAPSPGRRRFPR